MLWRAVLAYAIAGGILDAIRRRPDLQLRLARARIRLAMSDVRAAGYSLARAREDARRAVRDAARVAGRMARDVHSIALRYGADLAEQESE